LPQRFFPLNQVYFKAAERRKFRKEGEITLRSREKGDLPSCPSPLLTMPVTSLDPVSIGQRLPPTLEQLKNKISFPYIKKVNYTS